MYRLNPPHLPKKRKYKKENKTINDKRPKKTNGDNATRGSVQPEIGRAKEDRIGERDRI